MIIENIQLKDTPEGSRVSVVIHDEKSGNEKEVFFETSEQYKGYLVTEVYDAFVMAALAPALVSGQNIKVRGGYF